MYIDNVGDLIDANMARMGVYMVRDGSVDPHAALTLCTSNTASIPVPPSKFYSHYVTQNQS